MKSKICLILSFLLFLTVLNSVKSKAEVTEDNSNSTITLNLKKGWNLEGTSFSINVSVFNKPSIIALWKWNGNSWSFWSPNQSLMQIAQLYGLEKLDEIYPNDGFWVKTNSSTVISLSKDNKKILTIKDSPTKYKFWDLTYPNKYFPQLSYSDKGYYILTGSQHGIDGFFPEYLENIDFSKLKEISISYRIKQLNGEYSDGGFGLIILLKNDKVYYLENNRDNDGTNHYEVFVISCDYDNGTKSISNCQHIYSKETELWNIDTIWDTLVTIKDGKISYSFASEDNKYKYADNINISVKLSDIKKIGLGISWHKVSYALYNVTSKLIYK